MFENDNRVIMLKVREFGYKSIKLYYSDVQLVSDNALVVCKSGHLRRSNDCQTRFGDELPTRCKCGAIFIAECPNCKEEIREGNLSNQKTIHKGDIALPKYCIACGSPYPWTQYYAKGHYFEAFVCNLFPSCDFDIIHATTTRNDLYGRKIEEAKDPDFRFHHRSSGHYFWVECKFRTTLYDGKIKWAEKWQMERYQQFQKSHRPEKVYVVIGFGGDPTNPNSLYAIPLDEISYPRLFPMSIEKYSRSVNKEFGYQGGRLR
jgi:hypothetical protein